MSGWGRANSTQRALAEAEEAFEEICNTDGEVSEEEVEFAYCRMAQAAAEADVAFNEIWVSDDNRAATVAMTLRS